MIKFAAAFFWLVGIIFAIYAFMGLFIPLAFFVSLGTGQPITLLEVSLLFLSFQIHCGYFIWVGWAFEVKDIWYPLRGRSFWSVCAIHHILWIIYFGMGPSSNRNSFTTGLFSYLGIVVVISIACIFLAGRQQRLASAANRES